MPNTGGVTEARHHLRCIACDTSTRTPIIICCGARRPIMPHRAYKQRCGGAPLSLSQSCKLAKIVYCSSKHHPNPISSTFFFLQNLSSPLIGFRHFSIRFNHRESIPKPYWLYIMNPLTLPLILHCWLELNREAMALDCWGSLDVEWTHGMKPKVRRALKEQSYSNLGPSTTSPLTSTFSTHAFSKVLNLRL